MNALFHEISEVPLHDDHHAEFKLSITKALGDQLSHALSELTPAPLDELNIERIRKVPGVYQLWHGGELV